MIIGAPRDLLASLFEAAVAAADPLSAMRAHLPRPPKGRTIVVGAGKAASQMARALETLWDGPLEGVVVARHGEVEKCAHIRVLQSAHPVPDSSGLTGSAALLAAVRNLTLDDLVIALISGGGSALLPAPAGILTLEDEIAVNRALLASGAPISAMNVVRKHISRIKGGRLAFAAAPAKVVSLVISDVPGDNPALVASGPTIPDASTCEEAVDIVRRYHMDLPVHVLAHLNSPEARAPLPADPAFAGNETVVIASAGVSLEAAVKKAEALGLHAVILSDSIEGEAREIGKMHAALAREIAGRRRPFVPPVVLLSGGETTVTMPVDSKGRGGRNSEFLLSLALGIDGLERIHALAADTDGIDGSQDNAGAFADGGTVARIQASGGNAGAYLAAHDAYTAFSMAGDVFVTGPTGTNVNDFRAILITA